MARSGRCTTWPKRASTMKWVRSSGRIQMRRIQKKGSAAEREAIAALGITEKTWTLASLAARDHHHIARDSLRRKANRRC